MESFPVSERERIGRLYMQKDRVLSATGLALLNWLGLPLSELKRTSYNRPVIDENESDNYRMNFNISHSGSYVVLGLAEKGRVGIDIEHKLTVDLNDFTQVMSENEIATCKTQDAFYRLWTSKEAVIKALGTGFQQDVREIILEPEKAMLNGEIWHLNEINVAASYHCVVATDFKPESIEICHVKPEQLIEKRTINK